MINALTILTLFAALFWLADPALLLDWVGVDRVITLRLIKALIYLAALGLGIASWRQILAAAWREKGIVALVVLAMLSPLWSDTPLDTLQHALTIALTTLIGAAAVRLSQRQVMLTAAAAFATLLALSLLTPLIDPAQATYDQGVYIGAWRGIQGDKNALGPLAAQSVMLLGALSLADARPRWRWCFGLTAGIALMLLILSFARASVIALVVGVVVYLVMTTQRAGLRPAPTIAGVLVIVLAVLGMLIKPAQVLNPTAAASDVQTTVQQMPTLVGRTVIWGQVAERIAPRPLLGYGYNTFWALPDRNVHHETGEIAGSAHNGYLEFLLDLGIVGLMVFAAQAAILIRRTYHAPDVWPLVFITILLVNALASSLLMENLPYWILYVYCSLSACSRASSMRI